MGRVGGGVLFLFVVFIMEEEKDTLQKRKSGSNGNRLQNYIQIPEAGKKISTPVPLQHLVKDQES